MNESVQTVVARGAAWLDMVRPGWEGLIVLDTLNIRSPYNCVAGQVFDPDAGDYTGYTWCRLHMFGGASEQLEARVQSYNSLVAYGLDTTHTGGVTMDNLTAAWKSLISERRAARHAEQDATAELSKSIDGDPWRSNEW
jgi:hypothetical protein